MLQYIYNPMKDVWGLYDIVKCNDASYIGTAKTRVSQGSFLAVFFPKDCMVIFLF